MTDWVPVMVPPELATRVLRLIADNVDAAEDAGPRPWEDATAADVAAFVSELNQGQRRLVVALSHTTKPQSTASYADLLGTTIDDIAGYVGPINKRARKRGWMSPLRSERHFRIKDKVLVLDERIAVWVREHYEEEEREP